MRNLIHKSLAIAFTGLALAACQPKAAEAPPAFDVGRFDKLLLTHAKTGKDAEAARALNDFVKTASPADKERVARGEATVDFTRQSNVERTICRPTHCHVTVHCTQHWWRGDVNDCSSETRCDDIDPSDCHNG